MEHKRNSLISNVKGCCFIRSLVLCGEQVGVKGNPQGFNQGLDCDVIVAEVCASLGINIFIGVSYFVLSIFSSVLSWITEIVGEARSTIFYKW